MEGESLWDSSKKKIKPQKKKKRTGPEIGEAELSPHERKTDDRDSWSQLVTRKRWLIGITECERFFETVCGGLFFWNFGRSDIEKEINDVEEGRKVLKEIG